MAVLADDRLRAEFTVKLKAFLDTLDVVLPRPEGLPYAADAKRLAFIHARARNRYTPVLGKDVGAKVRKLIDDHVVSISLTDADFGKTLAREPNDRAKASEMEHAIRAHIRENIDIDTDPVAYRKLSERLRALLDRLGEQWADLAQALQGLIADIRSGQVAQDDTPAEVPEHCGPFLRLLVDAVAAEHTVSAAELTPTFWRPNRQPAQDALASQVFERLMGLRHPPLPNVDALVDQVMALARANHERLLKT